MADIPLALTLWRPWPFAIFWLRDNPKRGENRGWKPPRNAIGRRVAIHAGKRYDREADEDIAERCGWSSLTSRPQATDEGVVGTVIVKGWFRVQQHLAKPPTLLECSPEIAESEALALIASGWCFGPYVWVLDGVRRLIEPVTCKGAQGLWTLPTDVAARVDAQSVIGHALSRLYTPDESAAWLCAAHRLLDHRPPRALIREGRTSDVLAVLDQLESGAFI